MRPKDEAFHRARGSKNPLTPGKYNLFSAGKGTFFDTVSLVQEISKKGLDHPVECSFQTNKKQEIKSWLL
jgi:hypothetical protein